MNLIALKMLMGDKLKYFSLIFGIAFATLLIAQQASIFLGLMYNTGASIRDTVGPYDLWVMDPEVQMSEEYKPLPDTALDRVRSVSGVEWAVPLMRIRTNCRLPDGKTVTCLMVGVDDATLVGGPAKMVQGKLTDLRRDQAIMVEIKELDRTLKLKPNPDGSQPVLQVGDSIDINDNQAIITGFFEVGRKFFWEPLIYTTYNRALSYAPKTRKMLTFILAKAKPGQNIQQVADNIQQTTGLKALTREQFQELTKQYVMTNTGILINFSISMALGFVIGLLVCGQILYNFTLDNLKYFATLKALGATNGRLFRIVATQVVVVGSMGYGIGLGAAALFGTLMSGSRLAFLMVWQIPVVAAGAISIICLLAGFLSLLKVLRQEPGIVFR
ncbi:MAG: FtsX-like permease family protein [Alphaproteobacteria bacterium]|nr:MAG: FtsX-like permease family protein [Alphaproteobacteria bacterium]